jgi:hypothetical protein
LSKAEAQLIAIRCDKLILEDGPELSDLGSSGDEHRDELPRMYAPRCKSLAEESLSEQQEEEHEDEDNNNNSNIYLVRPPRGGWLHRSQKR